MFGVKSATVNSNRFERGLIISMPVEPPQELADWSAPRDVEYVEKAISRIV